MPGKHFRPQSSGIADPELDGVHVIRLLQPDKAEDDSKSIIVDVKDGERAVVERAVIVPMHYTWRRELWRFVKDGRRLVCSSLDSETGEVHNPIKINGKMPTGNCGTCPFANNQKVCKPRAVVHVYASINGGRIQGPSAIPWSLASFGVSNGPMDQFDDSEDEWENPTKMFDLSAKRQEGGDITYRQFVIGEGKPLSERAQAAVEAAFPARYGDGI